MNLVKMRKSICIPITGYGHPKLANCKKKKQLSKLQQPTLRHTELNTNKTPEQLATKSTLNSTLST